MSVHPGLRLQAEGQVWLRMPLRRPEKMTPNEIGFWLTSLIITLCIIALTILIDWRAP
jgi:hypothetical protein